MDNKRNYSILLVAYKASLLQILPFVKYLKKENPAITIHLLTSNRMDSNTSQLCDYASRIIRIHKINGSPNNIFIHYFNLLLLLLPFVFLSFNRYDIVNIHFPIPVLHRIMPWLKRASTNVVVTPWGSDVLRLEDEDAIKKMQKIYSFATFVTCNPRSQLGATVVEKLKYDQNRIFPLQWGLEYVDFIEEERPNITEEEAKARFGLTNRYVISCGYSTAPSHRHEAIIDAVQSIIEYLPKNLTLLFPFTYGWGTKQYIQLIKDKCYAYGIDAVYIEDFLDYRDLHALRMATDIFIHVQTTDAGASCVMQYILCKKKIVHGSWMRYVDLEEFKPLFYFPVDDLNKLGAVILEAYYSDSLVFPEGLIDTIMKKGWKREIKKWDSFFINLS